MFTKVYKILIMYTFKMKMSVTVPLKKRTMRRWWSAWPQKEHPELLLLEDLPAEKPVPHGIHYGHITDHTSFHWLRVLPDDQFNALSEMHTPEKSLVVKSSLFVWKPCIGGRWCPNCYRNWPILAPHMLANATVEPNRTRHALRQQWPGSCKPKATCSQKSNKKYKI